MISNPYNQYQQQNKGLIQQQQVSLSTSRQNDSNKTKQIEHATNLLIDQDINGTDTPTTDDESTEPEIEDTPAIDIDDTKSREKQHDPPFLEALRI